MSLPVRCFTCGYPIGQYEQKFINLLESKGDQEKAVKAMNMKQYCCQRMFLGYVNIAEQLLLFPESIDIKNGKKSESED